MRMSIAEEDYVEALMTWDESRRSWDWLLCNLALVVAGIFVVGAASLTYRNLNDQVIFGVLVPGFVVGLLFVGLHVFGRKRIRERHKLATIVRKMKDRQNIEIE